MKIIFFFLLITNSSILFASNGDFILKDHPWAEKTKAVVPIYQGPINFESQQKNLLPSEVPQANCTGTLVNGGTHLLSAAHCFRDLCKARKAKKKESKASDFFILVNNQKIFFDSINLHPKYCYLAYELGYDQKTAPNPLFPEIEYDISVSKIKESSLPLIESNNVRFPTIRFEATGTEPFEVLNTVGYGVSDRFVLYGLIWFDKDKDNVHDYWDLCPNTETILVSQDDKFKTSAMLMTNGCSANQKPAQPAIAMDYFKATKVSHKRGYSFSHFSESQSIFKNLRLSSKLFLVNRGFHGSLKPFKNLSPLSFGGDSGGGIFNKDFSEVVAITILANNAQQSIIDNIKSKELSKKEQKLLLHSGFNVFLRVTPHRDFIKETLLK